jgi:hypothetical protein
VDERKASWWAAQVAVELAHRSYTQAWHRAMRMFDLEPDLKRAMNRYNENMQRAFAEWERDIDAADCLRDGVPF